MAHSGRGVLDAQGVDAAWLEQLEKTRSRPPDGYTVKLSVLALDYDGTIAREDRLDPSARVEPRPTDQSIDPLRPTSATVWPSPVAA